MCEKEARSCQGDKLLYLPYQKPYSLFNHLILNLNFTLTVYIHIAEPIHLNGNNHSGGITNSYIALEHVNNNNYYNFLHNIIPQMQKIILNNIEDTIIKVKTIISICSPILQYMVIVQAHIQIDNLHRSCIE